MAAGTWAIMSLTVAVAAVEFAAAPDAQLGLVRVSRRVVIPTDGARWADER